MRGGNKSRDGEGTGWMPMQLLIEFIDICVGQESFKVLLSLTKLQTGVLLTVGP